MRIGIDASRAAIAKQTGTERYSQRIIQELLDLIIDEQVRLFVNGKQPIPFRQRADVTQRLIPFPRLWTHCRLSAELARHPVDALFVPSHVVPPVHPDATVVTVHDLGYLHEPDAHTDSARRYLEWSTRWSVKAARRVIAISESTKQDLVARYGVPPEKITVIHHGVDERFRPASRAEIDRAREWLGIDGPFVLYVGTIQPRKNLVRLVQAFERIADQHPDLHLVLVGKRGWKTEEITYAAQRSRYSSRIILPGHAPDDLLPGLYSAATVFTLPSLYEGFGMPVVEAMACGTPCIVSNRGSLPEIAGDAAVIIDPMDVDGMAISLSNLLSDDERATRIDAGIKHARSFSWTRAGEMTLETIRDAMREDASRHGR
ncbi:MAG: glycosyltransferase family 1 protein [Nitrolancea sp.]